MRKPISPFLLVAAIFLVCISSSAQKKPGSAQCIKPTVVPTDTTCFLGSGCRDSSFNQTGFAYYELLDAIKWVSALSDGKIIAVGEGPRYPDSPTGRDLRIMRFNADGSLDTTFGDVDMGFPANRLGYTHIPLTANSEFVNSGALQPDGKILAGGWSSGIWWVVRTLPDGTLDSSFDGDGIRTFASSEVGAREILVQQDGKIVVGGGPNFTVTRFNSDGSLDDSFGIGGTATYNAGSKGGRSNLWSIVFHRVATAPTEDRIVIGGWSNTSANGTTSFALMRLRSDGSLDTTFGSSGKTTTSFFGRGDQVRDIAIDPSNRVVAAGIARINSCSATDFGIARYTESGQLDSSFGVKGKASLDLYNDDNSVYALTVQPDGKPIIGGNARVLATDSVNRRGYFALVRFDTAGNLDPSWGPGTEGSGVVTTMLTNEAASSFIFVLHQQPDGKILAGGISVNRPALARYHP